MPVYGSLADPVIRAILPHLTFRGCGISGLNLSQNLGFHYLAVIYMIKMRFHFDHVSVDVKYDYFAS